MPLARSSPLAAFRLAAPLIAAAGLFVGCRAGEPTDDPPSPLAAVEERAARIEAEPIGMGFDAGLEVHWWLVDDGNAAVARALASGSLADLAGEDSAGGSSAGDPAEFEPEALRAWQASGLRVYSFPAGSFAPLQRRLPPRSAWERAWIGQPVDWQELVAGRTLRRGELIRADGVTIPVPPGRLRLLVRGWLTPDADRSAVLHLELLPQIAQRNPALTLDPTREVEVISQLNAGRIFDTLHLQARLTPGRVYLIVPAAPEESWDAAVRAADRLASRADANDREPGGGTPAPADNTAEGDTPADPILREPTYEVPEGPIGPSPDLIDLAYGPSDGGPLSLGEAAFIVQPEPAGDDALPAPRRRLVIIILPRSPGRYGILP